MVKGPALAGPAVSEANDLNQLLCVMPLGLVLLRVMLPTAKLGPAPPKYEARLPVLDLAMPALRSLSREQYVIFRERVICLVMADQRLSTFEYVLSCVLSRHLDIEFGLRGQPADWWRPSSLLPGRVETILALLAIIH